MRGSTLFISSREIALFLYSSGVANSFITCMRLLYPILDGLASIIFLLWMSIKLKIYKLIWRDQINLFFILPNISIISLMVSFKSGLIASSSRISNKS